jgi:hypothetical protein
MDCAEPALSLYSYQLKPAKRFKKDVAMIPAFKLLEEEK